jgi:hypothetical protein
MNDKGISSPAGDDQGCASWMGASFLKKARQKLLHARFARMTPSGYELEIFAKLLRVFAAVRCRRPRAGGCLYIAVTARRQA